MLNVESDGNEINTVKISDVKIFWVGCDERELGYILQRVLETLSYTKLVEMVSIIPCKEFFEPLKSNGSKNQFAKYKSNINHTILQNKLIQKVSPGFY